MIIFLAAAKADGVSSFSNLDELNKKKFEYKEGFTYLNIISGVVEVLNNEARKLIQKRLVQGCG